jgi:ketol-acid reductoisomerase
MGQNYFNTLPLRLQLQQLGKCRFMHRGEFADGVEKLKGKKLVVVGCGSQGLNQGLNLRDSGLDVSYALRAAAIEEQRQSWKNATENGFALDEAKCLPVLLPRIQHCGGRQADSGRPDGGDGSP